VERVTISELRKRFSAYLRKARAGTRVIILDRNRPVARLERVGVDSEVEDRLGRLERHGLVSRGSQPVPLDLLKSEPPAAATSVLEALLEERREGR
jgi:antitoxin (DNA-binding transcriptional repressor) of toxin-antitoxin stability system